MENENEMQKTHNTHILSGSSEDDEDYLNKSNADLFLPEPNEEGDFNLGNITEELILGYNNGTVEILNPTWEKDRIKELVDEK